MSADETAGQRALPLARPLAVGRLSRRRDTAFSVEAGPEERAALARFLGVDRVDRLSFEGSLSPVDGEGWEARGRLVADLQQTCVVSLAPVTQHHDAEIVRLYLPAETMSPVREVTVAPDEADEPDPFTDTIDPAALAVESLVMMVDPYPRAEGAALGRAAFAAPGAEPLEDKETRPFAGLAALRQRLAKGEK